MITRREMLRSTLALGGAAFFAPRLFAAVDVPADRKFTEQLGWKIGPQIYSFKEFPFDEAVKEVAAQGVKIPFSIEYEAAWKSNQPQVAESIKFFDATAKQIVSAK